MAINSTLPAYLAQRTHWTSESVSRGFQLGAQMYQQSQQEKRMQRAQQLQEETKRYVLEEKERIAEGTVEVTRILSEMGQTGGYSDPALQAKFWDAVSRNPKFAASPAFKDVMDTFQYAEQAKARKELLGQTYDLRGDEIELKHLNRLDEFDAQLSNLLSVEGLRQEDRERLENLRQKNRLERDSLKPTRTGQLVHDLTETDLASMRAELTTIDNLFKEGKITGTKKPGVFNSGYSETPAAEYERRKREVMKSYDAKRIGTPRPVQPPSQTISHTPAPPAGERVPGTIYQTPKGPYKWNGTGWEAP